MGYPKKCPACAVVLPERVASCPNCDAKGELGLYRARIVVLMTGVFALVTAGFFWLTRPSPPDSLLAGVTVFRKDPIPSDDLTTVRVAVVINNLNGVPVNVMVRLVAIGHDDAVLSTEFLGPVMNIPAGGSRMVPHRLQASVIKDYEAEVVDVIESNAPVR